MPTGSESDRICPTCGGAVRFLSTEESEWDEYRCRRCHQIYAVRKGKDLFDHYREAETVTSTPMPDLTLYVFLGGPFDGGRLEVPNNGSYPTAFILHDRADVVLFDFPSVEAWKVGIYTREAETIDHSEQGSSGKPCNLPVYRWVGWAAKLEKPE